MDRKIIGAVAVGVIATVFVVHYTFTNLWVVA
jgi:hypothetical protein